MKPIKFSPDFSKKLIEFGRKDKKFFNKIQKQLKLFRNNPLHKSLRLHKISREVKSTWSISIDKSFRMLYTESQEDIYFFQIGTHDQVYRNQ